MTDSENARCCGRVETNNDMFLGASTSLKHTMLLEMVLQSRGH